MRTGKLFVILILAGLVIGGLVWWRQNSDLDAVAIRKLLTTRNQILQKGDGAGYVNLVHYPSVVEKTEAADFVRAVQARNQFLYSVARVFGGPAALSVAQHLPYLAEYSEKEIESCALTYRSGSIDISLPGRTSLVVCHTPDGWKLDPFRPSFAAVIAENSRAIAAFEAARRAVNDGKVNSPAAALQLVTNRFR